MKKRLLSMLMAVLMIVSLVPAVSAEPATTVDTEVYTVVDIKADADAKQPGIHAEIAKDTGDITKLTVKAFAKIKDQCTVCTNPIKFEQAATCTEAGISFTYCGTCGKQMTQIAAKGVAKVGHNFDGNFVVVKEPTCQAEGWGYATCGVCGEPVYVGGTVDAKGAIVAAQYKTEKAYNAAVEAATILYAATNVDHADEDALVVATETTYDENSKVEHQAYVAPKHVETIGLDTDKALEANYDTVVYVDKDGNIVASSVAGAKVANGTGVQADKYCPDCGANVSKDGEVTGLFTAHFNAMTVLKAGFKPVEYDDDSTDNGMTDLVYCAICNKQFGGTEITYEQYFGITGGHEVGDTEVRNAKIATCEDEGYTGDTYTWAMTKPAQGTAEAEYEWVLSAVGTEIPALGHNWVAAKEKAPTCVESGYHYNGYYECDRVIKDADDEVLFTCTAYKGNSYRITDAALGHNYVETVLVEATCQHGGLNVYVCNAKDCNVVLGQKNGVQYTVKVDCVAAEELANVVEATCTEPGYTGDKVCKWCGDVLAKGEATEALGHTEEAVEAVAATCTEAGLTAGTKCSVCGEVITAQTEVPALGHKFENGACTVCEAADPDYVAPVAPEFTDAKEISEWAGDAVAWAVANDIIKGRTDGSFDPKANVTRADLVVMLWRQAGEPESTAKVEFTDAADIPEYAVKAIAWAVEKGIVSGYEDNSFKPAADVTRAELVKMLYVMVGTKVETAATFSDVVAGEWYVDAINWAAAEKVTSGRTDGTFGVADNATREEAVTFLFNALAK